MPYRCARYLIAAEFYGVALFLKEKLPIIQRKVALFSSLNHKFTHNGNYCGIYVPCCSKLSWGSKRTGNEGNAIRMLHISFVATTCARTINLLEAPRPAAAFIRNHAHHWGWKLPTGLSYGSMDSYILSDIEVSFMPFRFRSSFKLVIAFQTFRNHPISASSTSFR